MRLFQLIVIAGWLIASTIIFGFHGKYAVAASSESVKGNTIRELPASAGWPEEEGAGKGVSEYSNSDFIVDGIVFHSDKAKRSAYIRKKGSEHGKVLHIGDSVGPFRLSVVEDKSVTLYHVDRILILKVDRLDIE